ncbi:hypothetical protein SS05631_c33790 [Sinorhizobium sp. CCBAU 05631]|nr:hypothetical protein SS05631_c33790 [Sinorhizobium sp. CCBAU 05631]
MHNFPDPLTSVARKIVRQEGFRGGDILVTLLYEAHYTGHAIITLETDLHPST